MKKRLCCALLALLLAAPLCACGGAGRRGEGAASPAEEAPAAAEAVTMIDEPVFPLLSAPFSESESEAMVNHNAARFALLVDNFYYTRGYYADGGCALVRYEVIDATLHRRTVLVDDGGAEYLTEMGGRLYYLGREHTVESVSTGGGDAREELALRCRSLQLYDGALLALLEDGSLLALREGERETLLGGCSWAFASSAGIFYTALSDGRAHLYRPETRTDVTLTAAAAETPTVIGQTLYYLAREGDGGHLCALDLSDGTSRRMASPVSREPDFIRLGSGWGVRLFGLPGETQQRTAACEALFDEPLVSTTAEPGRLFVCRGLDGELRTDEILYLDGTPLGTALILPDGRSYPLYAEDNPRN